MRKVSVVLILLSIYINLLSNTKHPYQNPRLSIEIRISDLLTRMTLEEKFWQMYMIPGDIEGNEEKYKHGIFGFQTFTKGNSSDASEQMLKSESSATAIRTVEKINKMQRYFVEETRLGIPIIPFDEALHGLVRDGATAFPQSIALAATWNTELMKNVANAIARETKARGIRQILSPVLNIARDVRWGRVEETYGEDPYLASQMGLAFISEFENMGVITTPKHFVANVGDGGRDSYPIHYNERLMKEIYFPAFKLAFQKAGARSVMTSYNSYNGSPCTGSKEILTDYLKNRWGFKGFVISDAGAVGGANVLHYTSKGYAESTKKSVEAGLDVIFQTSYDHYKLFKEAFDNGMINSESIDNAVARILRAKFELGLFENPYVNVRNVLTKKEIKRNGEIARNAAAESFTLLKNNNNILPLNKRTKVALIGSDAVECRLGGYSGPGNVKVSLYDAMKKKYKRRVKYSQGCTRTDEDTEPIPESWLFHYDGDELKSGLKAEYYNNVKFTGSPELSRVDKSINFRWTLFSPAENINYDHFAVHWKGILKPDVDGEFQIGVKGNDGYKIFVNNKLFIDNSIRRGHNTTLKSITLNKNTEYVIEIKYTENSGNSWFSLVRKTDWEVKQKKKITEAVNLIKDSDVAVICAGIEEGEFRDRAKLDLSRYQEELIIEASKSGKPIVVLLFGGSAITMGRWINHVDAIMDVWYPGEKGGNAIADILYGKVSPSGKLPVTFPKHVAQCPLFYNHKPTGRGDDYLNLSGQPEFPFGFGLSYSTFEYKDLIISKTKLTTDESFEVSCSVKNTGDYDAKEVVQLYIRDEIASVSRPVMELKDFNKIYLRRGETKRVSFTISPEKLKLYDINMNRVVEPGEFRIMIGSSSKDIRLRGMVEVSK